MFQEDRIGLRLKVTLLLLGLAALMIRLWGLTRQSLWIDEVFSVKYAGLGESMSWAKLQVNLQGPLHAFLLFLWTRLFGWSELSVRLPQAIISACTVPLLYLVARKDFGERVALAGAIALAINPFHVWYAQEVRNYAFVVFCTVLAIRASRTLEEKGGRASVAKLAGSWTAGLLCNMSFAFHAIAVVVHGLLVFRRRKAFLLGVAAAAATTIVLLLPWEIGFYQRRVESSYLLRLQAVPQSALLRGETTAPILGIPYAAYTFAAGFSLGPSLRELHDLPAKEALSRHLFAVASVALVFGTLGVSGVLRWVRGDERRRFWLVCLVVPIVFGYLIALRNVKAFNPRYLSVALPAFVMLIADGADSLRPRALGVAAASAAVVLCATSLIQLATLPVYWKEDTRAATRILRAEMRPGDLVVAVGTLEPITRFYWLDLFGNKSYGRYILNRDNNPDDPAEQKRTLDAIHAARRTFVVFYREGYNDPDGKWEAFIRSHFPVAQTWEPLGIRIWRLGSENGP